MKALIGVDTASSWKPALNLVTRLWPQGLEVVLVHCLESLLPDGSFPPVANDHPLGMIQAERMRQGREALDQAASELAVLGVPTTTWLDTGDPAKVLVHQADRHHCDLIAVASAARGFWDTTFFGSTAKGVLIGARQSVLVVKNPHDGEGRVSCVLATDHSPYMAQCIDRLENLNVLGMGHLTVFTANETRDEVIAALTESIPSLASEAEMWVQGGLTRVNAELAKRLAPAAISAEAMVLDMRPSEGIREAMRASGAELLMMGAQGHGFFERLTMGSKSLRACLEEPFSVLVLRVG